MIISIWKPKFKNINKQTKCLYYIKQNLNNIKSLSLNVKVVYKCDYCGSINNTTLSSLKNAKWNTINNQMCRKCRSIKSERECKNNIITYEKFKSKIEKINYKVLSSKSNFDYQLYPSQAKMKIMCNNKHVTYTIWNNFVNKNKRCRKCYEENKYKKAIKYKKGFRLYKYLVIYYTKISYEKYKTIINPNNYKRSHNTWHLDHKFSIIEGFKQNILPSIIGNVCNLTILNYKQNIQKQGKCSLTKEQLFKKYKENFINEI